MLFNEIKGKQLDLSYKYKKTMKKRTKPTTKTIGVLLLVLLFALPAQAQFLRTTYFMEGASNNSKLNPALQPNRGYSSVPFLGNLNLSATSSTLGIKDIIDVFNSDDDFYNNDKFFNLLSTDNHMNISLGTELLSLGFFNKKNFWSLNVGARLELDASIPKSMFNYMRTINSNDFSWSNTDFDIRNEAFNMNMYAEIGVGYSRPINNRLTIGGKAKLLVGFANLNLDVKQISIYGNIPESWENIPPNDIKNYSASIKANASFESTIKGMTLTEDENGYIEDIELDKLGISGYGGAIDLGATYRLLDNLTISAAIIDLGFISWAKGASTLATANSDRTYDQNNFQEFEELISGSELLDYELIGLTKQDVKKARKSPLASTLVIGGEYGFFNNKLSVGALSTTRFGKLRTLSELTFSVNYCPKNWFNTALSYSVIQSMGKSFGFALKLGPLMVGTDYMFFGNNTKNMNAYLGISFSLGKQKLSNT